MIFTDLLEEQFIFSRFKEHTLPNEVRVYVVPDTSHLIDFPTPLGFNAVSWRDESDLNSSGLLIHSIRIEMKQFTGDEFGLPGITVKMGYSAPYKYLCISENLVPFTYKKEFEKEALSRQRNTDGIVVSQSAFSTSTIMVSGFFSAPTSFVHGR